MFNIHLRDPEKSEITALHVKRMIINEKNLEPRSQGKFNIQQNRSKSGNKNEFCTGIKFHNNFWLCFSGQ